MGKGMCGSSTRRWRAWPRPWMQWGVATLREKVKSAISRFRELVTSANVPSCAQEGDYVQAVEKETRGKGRGRDLSVWL